MPPRFLKEIFFHLPPELGEDERAYMDQLYAELASEPDGAKEFYGQIARHYHPDRRVDDTGLMGVKLSWEARMVLEHHRTKPGEYDAAFIENTDRLVEILRTGDKVLAWWNRFGSADYEQPDQAYSPELAAAGGAFILKELFRLRRASEFKRFLDLLRVEPGYRQPHST